MGELLVGTSFRLPPSLIERMPKTKRSQWLREIITAALDGDEAPTADELEELRRLTVAVRQVGVNVNQIARALNASADGSSAPPTDRAIRLAADECRQVLAHLQPILRRYRRGR